MRRRWRWHLAAWFARAGYPYPAKPTLDLDGDYPLVVVWDDRRTVILVMACTEDERQVQAALAAAVQVAAQKEASGDAPTGALGLAVCGGFIHSKEDSVISSIPIKRFLGGEE